MTKNQKNDRVGDVKAPALQATESGLRIGADQAEKIETVAPGPAAGRSSIQNLAFAINAAATQKGSPVNCKQAVWLSFFFDGTGNNGLADLVLRKHSNIVRLFRAHKLTSKEGGVCAVYIPGIGTYFPEIGDNGGSALGLGCGAMGDARLDFALKQFDEFLALPLAKAKAPANAIQEINIAVFGFSRGAALGRAFVNMVMKDRCTLRNDKWALQNGGWPVRFRFLGLFDTVASVGLPMSSGTTGAYEAYKGDTAGLMENRRRKYETTRPEVLAFAANALPGADPASGNSHGNDDWGGRLQVHETVEEVRHFIAAHEIRNSFPVDSVSILEGARISKPQHFYETVYPGVHSDVGGGYAPGEGAKGIRPSENLSLIPLRHMYGHAVRQGVPMLVEWKPDNEIDFETDPTMCATYDAYLKAVGPFGNIGDGMNRHMALYYAWRFRAIRRKANGDTTEARLIQAYDSKFRQQDGSLTREVDGLAKKDMLGKLAWDASITVREMREGAADGSMAAKALSGSDADVETARENYEAAHHEYLNAKARKDSLPNMSNLQVLLALYDRQLLADIRAIRPALPSARDSRKTGQLRPHYKVLIEAYENEFERNNGLKDEKIISFFDNYVHDSLAGFGKDATLPSDPRVVYMGGDKKYKYASLDDQDALFESSTLMA